MEPVWYLYAYEAQKIIGSVKPTKSGTNEERATWQIYRIACDEKGYEGTEADWHFLLWRLKQTNCPRRLEPD